MELQGIWSSLRQKHGGAVKDALLHLPVMNRETDERGYPNTNQRKRETMDSLNGESRMGTEHP